MLARRRVFLALLMVASITGCRTGEPGPAGFASVVIPHHTAAEIQSATARVFAEAGYPFHSTGTGGMVFEKRGSRGNHLAHGGWITTDEGNQTWVRVKADLVDLGGGAHRLQCQAFMVPHHGDSIFEEEKKVANFRSGPYQKLLDQVAERLKQP